MLTGKWARPSDMGTSYKICSISLIMIMPFKMKTSSRWHYATFVVQKMHYHELRDTLQKFWYLEKADHFQVTRLRKSQPLPNILQRAKLLRVFVSGNNFNSVKAREELSYRQRTVRSFAVPS
jgi:hypothetical protein